MRAADGAASMKAVPVGFIDVFTESKQINSYNLDTFESVRWRSINKWPPVTYNPHRKFKT